MTSPGSVSNYPGVGLPMSYSSGSGVWGLSDHPFTSAATQGEVMRRTARLTAVTRCCLSHVRHLTKEDALRSFIFFRQVFYVSRYISFITWKKVLNRSRRLAPLSGDSVDPLCCRLWCSVPGDGVRHSADVLCSGGRAGHVQSHRLLAGPGLVLGAPVRRLRPAAGQPGSARRQRRVRRRHTVLAADGQWRRLAVRPVSAGERQQRRRERRLQRGGRRRPGGAARRADLRRRVRLVLSSAGTAGTEQRGYGCGWLRGPDVVPRR